MEFELELLFRETLYLSLASGLVEYAETWENFLEK
jgi:hypothetical protein